MRVLVACEFSGVVRRAFRARGHDAWSCDLLPAEDGDRHHLLADVRAILAGTAWDLMIAHPPCTYLNNAGAWAFTDGPYHQKVKPGTLVGAARRQARAEAYEFFMELWNASIPKICIENPTGSMSTLWRPPDQCVQPWQFGDDASKATCFWLKGLPSLQYTDVLPGGRKARRANQTPSGQNKLPPSEKRARLRGITYPGIAAAMSAQWGQQ